ncbi:MAG: CHRD domain-containing protein [Dermatophilaceae bacterium]
MKRTMIALALVAAVGGGSAATATAAPDRGTGRPLTTTLTPDQEVAPFAGIKGASGSFSARLNPGRGLICVDLTTEGVDLVLAHIHEGPAGTNGPVLFDFSALVDPESGTAAGCLAADRALIKEIIANPSDYYVNVHEGVPPTAGFFQGVRGQLGR